MNVLAIIEIRMLETPYALKPILLINRKNLVKEIYTPSIIHSINLHQAGPSIL